MKQNQDLKRLLFIILMLILIGDFILVLLNGFFVWQLFFRTPQETPIVIDVNTSVQATQQSFELTQTQEAALTLMAAPTTETMDPTPETTATIEEQATLTESPTTTATPEEQTLLDNGYYTVKAGDNLQAIGTTFGVADNAIRTANQMAGDTILTGQQLLIPENGAGSVWSYSFSALPKAQQFTLAYAPPTDQTLRFTMHVDPSQYPANAASSLYSMQMASLNYVETFYHENLSGVFDLYVAGTLFDQDHMIRSASYPDVSMIFILFDGSGTKTDQLRMMTFETARFYGEKVLKPAASTLLKEGAAMYIAQQIVITTGYTVAPLRSFCATYLTDGSLPDLNTTNLNFKSETVDLINFQTAGCFYEYLYSQSSIDVMKQLYSSGDYPALLGKTLEELNADFRAWVLATPEQERLQTAGLTAAIQEETIQFQNFMPGFDGSPSHLEIYRELDIARSFFLVGSGIEAQVHLEKAKQLISNLN